jgi:MFS family permease
MIISDLNFKESISNNIIGFDVWFSGLFYASEIVGSFYSYKISDNYGRRPTLLFFSAFVAAFVSWSSATNSAFNLLITRVFVGFGIGILLSTSIVYLAEIALKSQRGKLISFIPLMITCGNGFAVLLYEMTRRQSDNWRTCLLFPVLVTLWLLLGLSLIPESPRWLLAHKSPPGTLAVTNCRYHLLIMCYILLIITVESYAALQQLRTSDHVSNIMIRYIHLFN